MPAFDLVPRTTVVRASDVHTTSETVEIDTIGARSLEVRIDVTVDAEAASVVFTIDRYDPAADAWVNVLTSAAVASVSTVVLKVDPDLAASANLIAQSPLYERMRIVATHADADEITYSVSANYSH